MINLSAIIPAELAGMRLDQALAALFPQYSRARLQTWIKNGDIQLNGQVKRPREIVREGESIVVTTSLIPEGIWEAEAIKLDIIYEDDALLIVNKAVGMVVHPAIGNHEGTLINALLHHAPHLCELPRAGIVHRLDKNTSGLLVVAKHLTAHTELVRQLQARTIKREYAAIVRGHLIAGGTIDAPIGRHPRMRTHMAVTGTGKPAITHYRILERFPAHTYLQVNLETGRTHQIRVHLAYIQHPIIGDPVYSGRLLVPKGISDTLRTTLQKFNRQALHAKRLGLIHPLNHEYQEWEIPLAPDMQQLLAALQSEQNFCNNT